MDQVNLNMIPDTPIQPVCDPWLASKGIELYIQRDDLIHPLVSGNKWFKLRNNLSDCSSKGCSRVLSFGGPYSNHLHALAALGARSGVETIGMVRGLDALASNTSETLEDARRWGMNIVPVSREQYRRRHEEAWLRSLSSQWQAMVIPEGGSNTLGALGISQMVSHRKMSWLPYNVFVIPVGSGGTFAGMIHGAETEQLEQDLLGICVLKGAQYLDKEVDKLRLQLGASHSLSLRSVKWRIEHDYHCGGYARISPQLAEFFLYFESISSIPLEPIYSGKMLFGLYKKIAAGEFDQGTKILALHTGGLQGLRGMAKTLEKYKQDVASEFLSPPSWMN